MNRPPLLEGRERYRRTVRGWADHAPAGGVFVHTVRVAEAEREVELAIEILPSPSYLIRALRARAMTGPVDPRGLDGLATLAGTTMVAGLGRRVRQAIGSGPGTDLLLDAMIEAARLSRQVGCLPREHVEHTVASGPRGFWQLDREGWIDLPDSCFTYSEAGAALLTTRAVAAAATPDLYCSRPGQPRVFERHKVAELAIEGAHLRLTHSMHDNVHGFEVVYEVELASGRFVRAESMTPRLPYAGICSEPQGKVRALLGETLDGGLAKRIQAHLGGVTGCAQLYDLTADLLKLVTAPRVC
ncbi:MAG: DUF2889 domain-containing protein [Candidatus Rokuibacteriota bacterium]